MAIETSNKLFYRVAELSIARPESGSLTGAGDPELVIKQLRMEFEVVQNLNKEPNSASITIYNLNKEQRGLFEEKGLKVTLDAGYETTIATVFTGDLKEARSYRDGSDWVTELECKDGYRTYAFAKAIKSFRKGTKIKDIITFVAGEMGLTLTANSKKIIDGIKKKYNNGKVLKGRAADHLDKLLKDQNLEWSIQNGRLQILEKGGTDDEAKFTILTPKTGLLGTPEREAPREEKGDPRYLAKSLLQPGLYPGKLVEIDSETLKKTIRADKVIHVGDTRGGDWNSDIAGISWDKS